MTTKKNELYSGLGRMFKHIISSDSVKLAWGEQQRRLAAENLAKDPKFENYRIRWLKGTRSALVSVLMSQAKEFNEAQRHDKISVADMIDALKSTIRQLEVAAERLSTRPQSG